MESSSKLSCFKKGNNVSISNYRPHVCVCIYYIYITANTTNKQLTHHHICVNRVY
jgi:hypothetical protein